jgi:crotonobetainyl-CoA:carnitine CoA-transferase CaiB-like acyl-CoA transferase
MPSATSPPTGPLAGIRIIDCSTVLAGPLCTMLLADFGADVIKVEPPEGDHTRTWGPPWLEGPGGEHVAAYYLSVNRNKRSLRLDLKQAAGRAVLEDLLRSADVVVENFRVGAFARLGFDDDRLRALNPGMVHLAITGYGPDGPAADRPGYDFVLQAAGGLMSITGASDAEGGEPTKVGVAISDVATGLFGAIGLLSALLAKRGDGSASTGAGGQRVDVSILESTLAILVNQAQNAFVTGRAPARMGNAHPNIVPYETFVTSDGEIAIAVGSERQWLRLCEALGVPDMAADPRFATNGDRVDARAELRPILAGRFATDPSASWLARLDAAGVPAGPINDIPTAFADPQAQARRMVVDVEHPTLGAIRQVGLPVKLDRTPGSIRSAPPMLGEHTDQILAEIGRDPAAIARLRADGVV